MRTSSEKTWLYNYILYLARENLAESYSVILPYMGLNRLFITWYNPSPPTIRARGIITPLKIPEGSSYSSGMGRVTLWTPSVWGTLTSTPKGRIRSSKWEIEDVNPVSAESATVWGMGVSEVASSGQWVYQIIIAKFAVIFSKMIFWIMFKNYDNSCRCDFFTIKQWTRFLESTFSRIHFSKVRSLQKGTKHWLVGLWKQFHYIIVVCRLIYSMGNLDVQILFH